MLHVIVSTVMIIGLVTVVVGVISGVITVTKYLFNNGDDESIL